MQIQFSTTLGPYFAELVCRACGTVCLRRPRFGPMLGAFGAHCRMYGSTLGCVGPIFAHVGPMLVMLGNVGPALGPHCAYLELFWAALEQRHRDLGVAQDCLGNFIYFLLDRFPGASKDKRLSSVFRSMQSFYRRSSVDNRLDTLSMGMLRKTDKKTNKVSAPKLRASAGETRSLIPWSLEIAEALLDKSNTFENTIFQATLRLNACYSLLSRLEPTRISYGRTKIPATLCLPL